MSDFLPGTTPVLSGVLGPPSVVPPPPVERAPHGLLDTAIDVTGEVAVDGGRPTDWVKGFSFLPESCDQGAVWVPCITSKPDELNPGGSGSGSGEQLKSLFDAPDEVIQIPFVVESSYTCNTAGWQVAEYAARARRNLEHATPKQVEHEFWTGEQMRAHPTGNANLSLVRSITSESQILNPGGLTPTAVSPSVAMALLQQGLANCAHGSRGTIHATPYLVSIWDENYYLEDDGRRLRTRNRGTWVVSGAGYPGSGPLIVGNGEPAPATGTTVWAYATGIVNYQLSEPRIIPGSEDTERAISQAMRPGGNGLAHGWDNKVTFRGERFAAAVYDPCCVVAVLVDLC